MIWLILHFILSGFIIWMTISMYRWMNRMKRIAEKIQIGLKEFESVLRMMFNPCNLNNIPIEKINDVDYLEGYNDGQLNGYALAVREIARSFGVELEETNGND